MRLSRRISETIILLLLYYFTTISQTITGTTSGSSTPWQYFMDRPILAALFLPPYHLKAFGGIQHHLATIESVRPILDVAISDAYERFLKQWNGHQQSWMTIYTAPINECEDQKKAAWAALEAVEWTNGLGLDVAFGPACDYALATTNRILSYSGVPMFTSAAFSEWFHDKQNNAELLTRVGPLQDHIAQMIEEIALKFSWIHPILFYEKAFWEDELLESGFCKMMVTGLFVRAANRKSTLRPNPQILRKDHLNGAALRSIFRQTLIDNVGVDRAG